MAIDVFMKLVPPTTGGPPCEGESQDAVYKGWTELSSFDMGVENVATIGSKAGGAGAGKANFKELSFTKALDSLSPSLFHVCATGGHFPLVEVALRRAGGAKALEAYCRYEFKMVFVKGVDWDASSGDVPRETVTLAYGALRVTYSKQDSTGKTLPGTSVAWSQVLNKPTFETE
ncbi:MAG: Hcp family type VI secretion system effector [Planctomycetota bacterium]